MNERINERISSQQTKVAEKSNICTRFVVVVGSSCGGGGVCGCVTTLRLFREKTKDK